MRFLGTIDSKADAKGRVFLPAPFRKVLATAGIEQLVLRKDIFQPCLVLYPESVWNQMLDTLRARLNRWNRQDQMVFRQFVSDVEPVALDGNGRFLIPRRYQQMAGIEGQVRFIGMDDSIEIWSGGKGQEPFMEPGAFAQALEERMGDAFFGAAEDEKDTNEPQP